MTVLQLTGPAVGGIRVHLWQLLERLPGHAVDALLVAPPDLIAPPGTRRVDMPVGERLHPLRDLPQVALLSRIHHQHRPALVHAHGYKAALLASVAGLRPLVLTFHNLWPDRAPGLARAGLRWAVRGSDRQIGVSQSVIDSVARVTGPLPRGEVIPNSIDRGHFAAIPDRAAARNELDLPADATVIGFAGRLLAVKGPQVLIDALPELAAEIPGVVLALAGEGPDRPALEAQAAAKGMLEQARFLGALTDVRQLMAASDVWAVPSLAEGGGIVALEALAAGVPLVASAVGGLGEVLEDGANALLTPPGDAPALAVALSRALADPQLAGRLREGGRVRVAGWPGPDAVVDRLVALYRSAGGDR